MTLLEAYVCASAAQVLLIVKSPARFGGRGSRSALVVSGLAVVYSVWAGVDAGVADA